MFFVSTGVLVAVIVGLFLFLYYFPLGLWIRTIAAGVPLSMAALIRMRLIGIQPGVIVTNLVRSRKAGLDLEEELPLIAPPPPAAEPVSAA